MEPTTKSITGFLGADPKVSTLEEKGTKVANFSVAVNSKDGVQWQSVTAWGADAEKVEKMTKGTKVTVSGQEKSNKGKDGKTYNFLNAKSIDEHKMLKSQDVVIGNIEFKTPKEKEICEIVGYRNYKNEAGEAAKETYKIAAFNNIKDSLKAEGLKVGDKITITADGKPNTFETKTGEKKTEINYTLIDYNGKFASKKTDAETSAEAGKKEEKAEAKTKEKPKEKTTKKSKSSEMER